MERYTSEKSLFPLEVALDLDYWRTLWSSVNQLPSRDREQAGRIIGTLLDKNNLMWAIRYREYHHLSEEEIINYTLPIGYHVNDEDIRAIAAGTDIPQVIRRVFPDLPDPERFLQDPNYGLSQLEISLQKHVADRCRAAFAGYPFHIGIPLAYLILKELEIQDLTVLIEAKSSQMPVERFQPYLLTAAAPE
jgi:vacuolar-type H+-ATPase subunit C/Vma6